MDPIVSVKNLSVVYDKDKPNEIRALDDVSFDVYPGEYIIFFGASGSGKSTLLYAIAGLERPTSGQVRVAGHDIGQMTEHHRVLFHQKTLGMIFQQYELVPHLSAFDNAQLPLIFSRTSPAARKKQVLALLSRFGIEQISSRLPSMLSGGQQQRVAIARSLVNDPILILADEPVGNLDSKNAEIVLGLLSKINAEEKKTIIHVTHNPRDLSHANRVIHIKDGKVERIIRNPDKSSPSLSQEKTSEIDLLRQAYPYLTDRRLQSKIILHHLLSPVSMQAEHLLEKIVERYLKGESTKDELFLAITNPPEKGGANLYEQRAKNLASRIADLADEMMRVRDDPDAGGASPDKRARILRDHLLSSHEGKLMPVQVSRLEEALLGRLLGKLDKKHLFQELDKPVSGGGVGLNRRTATHFVEETEIVLMR